MASDLTPVTIGAPGFYGLNLQDSPYDLPIQYALTAHNAIIDSYGRVGARKGWYPYSAASTDLGSVSPTLIHEYIKNDGSTEILCIGNSSILKLTGTTLSVIYTDTGWTGENWKAVNFNGKVYFFQRGNDPLVYDGTTCVKIKDHGSYTGTVQQANEVLAAYGRLWTVDTATDKLTVKWSDLLIGEAWSGGSSGSLNLATVQTLGTRPATALAAFNGYLIIFCDRSIIVYQGADDNPSTNLKLVDVIDNIGCIARDTVVDVGSDMFFLSDIGIHSLGRVVDQKSAPLLDVSFNVRDDLLGRVNGLSATQKEQLKAVYYQLDGFYLLTFPSLGYTYCFDLKRRLENNLCRVTTWGTSFTSFETLSNNKLLVGKPGYIGEYVGYSDNGTAYTFQYYSSHITADQPSLYKILKNARVLVYGGSNTTITFKWAVDYSGVYSSNTVTLGSSSLSAEYNVAEYNVNEYGSSIPQNRASTYLTNYGLVYQIAIEAPINNNSLSIQQLDTFVKLGRTA